HSCRHAIAAAVDGRGAVRRRAQQPRSLAVGRRAPRWRCSALAPVQAAAGDRQAVRPHAHPYRASHRVSNRGGRAVVYRHSLRRRVAIAFAMCVAALSVVWGLAFFTAIRLSEDRVLTRQLQRAAESYPTLTTNLRGYDEVGSLPESLREWAQSNPEEGLYEFSAEELHVAVIPTDNEQRQAFVVFDVAGVEAASSEDWWWLFVSTGLVGTLGALCFGLGLLVMRRAIAPVAQLAR